MNIIEQLAEEEKWILKILKNNKISNRILDV